MSNLRGVAIPFIQLAESADAYPKDGWFQILKTGTFSDPRYGKFNITRKMFGEMVSNFKEGVRGIVPALDYKHDSEDIAAGWFKELSERNIVGNNSELWARIELTPGGQKKLNEKEFGYLSADFDEAYTDNEAPFKKYGCVLKGAGLTNRPVIKGMKPAVQLAESEDDMTLEQLQKKCADQEKKLAETDTELAEAKKFSDMMKKVMAAVGANNPEDAMGMIQKKFPAQDNKDSKEMAELKAENEKLKRGNEFAKLLSEGKVVPAQEKAYLDGDMAEFAKAGTPGAVNLSERGHGTETTPGEKKAPVGDNTEESAEDKLYKLAEEERKKDTSLNFQESFSRVLSEPKNAELKKAYYAAQ